MQEIKVTLTQNKSKNPIRYRLASEKYFTDHKFLMDL